MEFWGTPNNTSEWTRANMYKKERGTEVYSGRPTKWTGGVGLMYASDYGYSISAMNSECDATMYYWYEDGNVANCKNNSWLYKLEKRQWTLSPHSDAENRVFLVLPNGRVSNTTANGKAVVYPVLYLKKNVKITSGNGSAESPFLLEYVE